MPKGEASFIHKNQKLMLRTLLRKMLKDYFILVFPRGLLSFLGPKPWPFWWFSVDSRLRFAALQSEAGKALLLRSGRSPEDISSLVLVEKDRWKSFSTTPQFSHRPFFLSLSKSVLWNWESMAAWCKYFYVGEYSALLSFDYVNVWKLYILR